MVEEINAQFGFEFDAEDETGAKIRTFMDNRRYC